MPSSSRRLPGGRLRPVRPRASASTPPPSSDEDQRADDAQVASDPVTRSRTLRTGPILDQRERRVGVTPRSTMTAPQATRLTPTRPTAVRRGPSLLDQTAQNFGHIRDDLRRIAVLSSVMLAVIVALSFVLT